MTERSQVWDGTEWVGMTGVGDTTMMFDLLHSKKTTADTPDDEFDSTTLDPKWTVVGGATSGTVDLMETGNVSKYDLTSRPGWLLMQAGANTSQVVTLRQDYTMADGESIVAAIGISITDPEGMSNNELPVGIGVNNSDTAWDSATSFHLGFDADPNQVNIKSWRNGVTTYGAANSLQLGAVYFLRIVRAGTVFHGFYSTDGVSWLNTGNVDMTATMPDNVWIFVEPGETLETPVPVIAVKWFRLGTSDVDPWNPHAAVAVSRTTIEVFDLLNSTKASADTPDDEFDETTLDGKWTVVAGSSGTVSLLETGEVAKYDLTTRAGWLLLQAGSDGTNDVQLRQDWTLGDGESIVVAVHGSATANATGPEYGWANNEMLVGISLNSDDANPDTTTTAGRALLWATDVDTGQATVHFTVKNTGGSNQVASEAQPGPFSMLFLRIARSGSTYYAFYSTDGMGWSSLSSASPSGTALDNLWVEASNAAAAADPVPIHAVAWVRQGTNDLDPWDSTISYAIVP